MMLCLMRGIGGADRGARGTLKVNDDLLLLAVDGGAFSPTKGLLGEGDGVGFLTFITRIVCIKAILTLGVSGSAMAAHRINNAGMEEVKYS